jgi:fructokinase
VPARSLRALAEKLPPAEVFFFDRPSPGAIDAARRYAEQGALIVFEPSAQGKPELFVRALELAHVVKYAENRMERLPLTASKLPRLILEIQTRGHNGLRYRCTLPALKGQGWRSMRALRVPRVVDTVGCGDWCTAGLLSRIGTAGVAGLQSLRADELRDGLQYGQALAAWNCGFLGARGGMYERSATQMKSDITRILDGRTSILGEQEPATRRAQAMSMPCPACHTSSERVARQPA